MKAQTILKLAHFTRRFNRLQNPLAYRLAKKLLKHAYPKPGRPPFKCVIAYDQGLINVDTNLLQEYYILFFGVYEPYIASLIKTVVKPGDLCIDIGANIGGLSLIMSFATGSKGKVIAVEPHPNIVQRLQANLELNRIENCQVLQTAISNQEGNTDFYIAKATDHHQGKSSLQQSSALTESISIQSIRGKDLLQEIGTRNCSFIKVDVEGHDLIVLQELEEIIKSHRPHIVFEYNHKSWLKQGCDLHQALSFFKEQAYTLYSLKNGLLRPLAEPYAESCDFFCVPKQ